MRLSPRPYLYRCCVSRPCCWRCWPWAPSRHGIWKAALRTAWRPRHRAARRAGALAARGRQRAGVERQRWRRKALPVRWDRARIEQLLGNLLENSLRYTDAPGRIAVTLERQGQRIFIDIADSAPGVPAGRPATPLRATQSRRIGAAGTRAAAALAWPSARPSCAATADASRPPVRRSADCVFASSCLPPNRRERTQACAAPAHRPSASSTRRARPLRARFR